MKKQLFERYVELNYYRIAAQQLCKNKLIARSDYRTILTKISQAELSLIMPKQSKTHPRKLTRVK